MGYQSKKKKQFVSFADGGSIELHLTKEIKIGFWKTNLLF